MGELKADATEGRRSNQIAVATAMWITALTLLGVPLAGCSSQKGSPAEAQLPSCDSADARQALGNAVENNAMKNIATLKLLDVQDTKELKFNGKQRLCAGTLVMNSGLEAVEYVLSRASTGDVLVQVGAVLDIETAAQPQTPTPAPTAAAASASSAEAYTYGIPRLYPAAFAAWRSAAQAQGFTADWSRDLSGDLVASGLRTIILGGKPYIYGSHCVAHECGSMEVAIMFPQDQSKVFGTVTHEPDGGGAAIDTKIGDPTPAEAACFEKASDTSIKTCD